MEKVLLEAISHIKSVSRKKPRTERLPTYINKSSEKNCNEAIIQDTLCILRTKDLIDENLKLLFESNKLVDHDISLIPLPEAPNTATEDANKNSDVVLNDTKKDLMRHINSE